MQRRWSARSRERARWRPPGRGDEEGSDRQIAERARAIAWAAALAADPRTLYLDTETTGFDAMAEVVDIAVIGASGEVLFESLVRPDSPIPADATAIHGIRNLDVATAPRWPDLHPVLCSLLDGRSIVVYNAPFDRRLLIQTSARHGLTLPANLAWECAMRGFAGFRGAGTAERGNFTYHKLEVAVAHFGGVAGGHRARGDALACRTVVLGMSAHLAAA